MYSRGLPLRMLHRNLQTQVKTTSDDHKPETQPGLISEAASFMQSASGKASLVASPIEPEIQKP